LQQVCPDCGGLLVAERGRKAKCTNCDWSGPATQAKERIPGAPVPTKRTAPPEEEAEGAPA